MVRVLVPLMTGFEEIEAVTVIDILRRAGVEVVTAGLSPNPIYGSHNIPVLADAPLDGLQAQDFAGIVLPGGPGTKLLREDPRMQQLILAFREQQKTIAAICAAPTVLSTLGLLREARATSHPSVQTSLVVKTYAEDAVVVDGSIITSRGAGTALAFALALVTHFVDAAGAQAIAQAVVSP
jgi:4-methyl-5(b-hydroxyethyl)-thiazole monophosphate biosynthesis